MSDFPDSVEHRLKELLLEWNPAGTFPDSVVDRLTLLAENYHLAELRKEQAKAPGAGKEIRGIYEAAMRIIGMSYHASHNLIGQKPADAAQAAMKELLEVMAADPHLKALVNSRQGRPPSSAEHHAHKFLDDVGITLANWIGEPPRERHFKELFAVLMADASFKNQCGFKNQGVKDWCKVEAARWEKCQKSRNPMQKWNGKKRKQSTQK